MKKQFVVITAVIMPSTAFGWGCKKKDEGMEDFSGALNMQYESYRIIKDNSDDPARAGKLFTEYYKKNHDALASVLRAVLPEIRRWIESHEGRNGIP